MRSHRKIGEGGMAEGYRVRRMSNQALVRTLVIAVPLLFFGWIPNSSWDQAASGAGAAQTDGSGHVFTYSVIQTTSDRNAVLAQLESAVIPMMVREGATPYSVWLPVELDGSSSRSGLREGVSSGPAGRSTNPERATPLRGLSAGIHALPASPDNDALWHRALEKRSGA